MREVPALPERWQKRGLKPEVLAGIRTNVFNVPAARPYWMVAVRWVKGHKLWP